MDRFLEMRRRVQEMEKSMVFCERRAKEIVGQLQLRGVKGVYYKSGHCLKINIGKRRLGELVFDTLSVAVAPDRYMNRVSDYPGCEDYVPQTIEGLLSNDGKMISQDDFEMLNFNSIDDIILKINELMTQASKVGEPKIERG
tara:strand:+ start:1377 stop:1802 length:426 start_codon:yes stop_codon:yes gene_type:complete